MPIANPLGSLFDIVEGFPTVDLQTADNNGDWLNLKNAEGVLIVFRSGVGTNGADPTLTLAQATAAAGTGDKALNFTTIYRKQAATSLAAVTAWTETTQTAASTYTNTDAAEQDLIWCVWVDAADLDVAGGFDHVRATVADIGGSAQPGDLLYIVIPKYRNNPENAVSYVD